MVINSKDVEEAEDLKRSASHLCYRALTLETPSLRHELITSSIKLYYIKGYTHFLSLYVKHPLICHCG